MGSLDSRGLGAKYDDIDNPERSTSLPFPTVTGRISVISPTTSTYFIFRKLTRPKHSVFSLSGEGARRRRSSFVAMTGNGTSPSAGNYIMATAIGLSSLPGIIGNILVCALFVKNGFLKPKESSAYKLSFSLMIADTVHLLVFLCYLAPAAAFQDWLIPDEKYRHLPGTIIVFCWDLMCLTLDLLALNR